MSALFNQTNIAPGTSFSGSGGGSNNPNPLFSTIAVAGTATVNRLSNVLYTSTNNFAYNCLDFTLRPTQAAQNGTIYAQLQWDAVDTGANYGLIVGANNTTGFIGTIWPGYITMPFQIFGATVDVISDNETFFHCDGKAGAIGSISTGTSFASSQNFMSSIQDLNGRTANMEALFSTLSNVYPACFN